mgnify:FL=1
MRHLNDFQTLWKLRSVNGGAIKLAHNFPLSDVPFLRGGTTTTIRPLEL